FGELLVDLRLLGLERLLDQDLYHFARLGRDLTFEHLAGEAVDRDEVAVLQRTAAGGDGAGFVVDLQSITADDANLAHLPADESSVTGSTAEGGQDAVGGLHAADVFGAGFASDEDHALAVLLHPLLGLVREELDPAGPGAGTGVDPFR